MPGSTVPVAAYSIGVSTPNALAIDPSGNLFVGNKTGSPAVSEFVPANVYTTGGVLIQSSVESRPMLIGGTNSAPVQGINLSSAELSQIVTTATGTITIGDTGQTGNITFSTATPATTAGAALNVIKATSGSGQIILDDASGTARDSTATAVHHADAWHRRLSNNSVLHRQPLATNGFVASGPLNLTLGFAPTPGVQLTIVNNTATPAASNPISGTFSNLPQGSIYTTSYLGTSYSFQVNYQGAMEMTWC